MSHTWITTGDPERNVSGRKEPDLRVASPAGSLAYAFGGATETKGPPVRMPARPDASEQREGSQALVCA